VFLRRAQLQPKRAAGQPSNGLCLPADPISWEQVTVQHSGENYGVIFPAPKQCFGGHMHVVFRPRVARPGTRISLLLRFFLVFLPVPFFLDYRLAYPDSKIFQNPARCIPFSYFTCSSSLFTDNPDAITLMAHYSPLTTNSNLVEAHLADHQRHAAQQTV
jgi:hypothetical protein